MAGFLQTRTIHDRPFLTALMLALALAWVVPPNLAMAQAQAESPEAPKPEKLFKSTDVIKISLKGPWRQIVKDKKNQNPYPATMEYTDTLGQSISIPLTVGRRGLTRQQACRFPPIKLRFKPEDVKNTIFHGQESLKMVTHCDVGERWEQYYVKEYVLYQIFRQMTDLSFRARPLSVTYIESSNDSSQDPRFAFLIEDDSDVAKRNDMKKLELVEIRPSQLQSEYASRVALFQYIIANVDYETTIGPKGSNCCHNARLFGLSPDENIYAIPYDFDGTGAVNTTYAAPNEFLPIKYVTQRLFRGFCVHNPTLEATRKDFLANEQAVYTIVRNETLLTEHSRDALLKFLQDSFDVLRDDEKFDKLIIQKCRK